MILGIQLLVVHKVSKAYDTTMLMGLPTMNGRLANAVAMEKGRKKEGKKKGGKVSGKQKGRKSKEKWRKSGKRLFQEKGVK